MVDEHHPLAEHGDVGHIVRRQQHRHAALAVDPQQEVADVLLGDDVQANRRLVQVEDVGVVQQPPDRRASAGRG